MNVFTYGTLMNRATLESVLDRTYEGKFEDATLENFVRLQPSYYMAFEEEGSHIDGKLISNLSDEDMQRLDWYESVDSGLYRRQKVTVTLSWNQAEEIHPKVEAFVYHNGAEFKKENYQ
jgi:gamma-glutamylcyclotransferase (GGCT)/AIG2-like uncharacterized protein YtfP